MTDGRPNRHSCRRQRLGARQPRAAAQSVANGSAKGGEKSASKRALRHCFTTNPSDGQAARAEPKAERETRVAARGPLSVAASISLVGGARRSRHQCGSHHALIMQNRVPAQWLAPQKERRLARMGVRGTRATTKERSGLEIITLNFPKRGSGWKMRLVIYEFDTKLKLPQLLHAEIIDTSAGRISTPAPGYHLAKQTDIGSMVEMFDRVSRAAV